MIDSRGLKSRIGSFAKYAVLILFVLIDLFPFYWVIISSLKESDKILVYPLAPPEVFKWSNYVEAWTKAKISLYFMNTLIVAAFEVIGILFTASLAAYILARVRPSFLLFSYFILGITIPIHALLVPDFIIINKLGLLGTRAGLILVGIGVELSTSIFILTGFMVGLPKELDEAARIDGASQWRTYFQIILPLSRPGLATSGILVFLFAWNNYLWPLVLITDQNKKLLSQGIQELKRLYTVDYGLMTAGIMLAIVPVIVTYILFQENIIKGMTAGAVKG